MTSWEREIGLRYPRPCIDNIRPYFFSLDGGGRELVTDALQTYGVDLMIEIGCFLCGSTAQWLSARESLRVIGVDPWDANFAATLERYDGNPVFGPCFGKIDDRKAFIESVRMHGPYASALANVRSYGERFIPIKSYSPEVLYELADLGIEPQLVYFDSNKVLDDLNISKRIFPKAILCGDDWTWGADQGYPVQKAVNEFCAQNNFTVITKRATWIVHPK